MAREPSEIVNFISSATAVNDFELGNSFKNQASAEMFILQAVECG